MKRSILSFLLISILPGLCFGASAKYTSLVREKQRKMAELEKCMGSSKGLKIAGLSTLGLTAVGVAGNIAEAGKIKDYDSQIARVDKKIDTENYNLEQNRERLAELNKKDNNTEQLSEPSEEENDISVSTDTPKVQENEEIEDAPQPEPQPEKEVVQDDVNEENDCKEYVRNYAYKIWDEPQTEIDPKYKKKIEKEKTMHKKYNRKINKQKEDLANYSHIIEDTRVRYKCGDKYYTPHDTCLGKLFRQCMPDFYNCVKNETDNNIKNLKEEYATELIEKVCT